MYWQEMDVLYVCNSSSRSDRLFSLKMERQEVSAAGSFSSRKIQRPEKSWYAEQLGGIWKDRSFLLNDPQKSGVKLKVFYKNPSKSSIIDRWRRGGGGLPLSSKTEKRNSRNDRCWQGFSFSLLLFYFLFLFSGSDMWATTHTHLIQQKSSTGGPRLLEGSRRYCRRSWNLFGDWNSLNFFPISLIF